jgi:hypothetical protein
MRTYERKGPRPWRNKDKRMIAAVRLRVEGKSLREIAKELTVSHETVRRDLARWHREHANVAALPVTSACHISPPRGQLVTPECDSGDGHVVAMSDRRKPARPA